MAQHRGESDAHYDAEVPRDSFMRQGSQGSCNSGARSAQADSRSSQRQPHASNGSHRSSGRERSLRLSFQAGEPMPEEDMVRSARNSRHAEDLRMEAIVRSARMSRRAEDERYAIPERTPVMPTPEHFQRGKQHDEQLTGQVPSRRAYHSECEEEDGGLCSEDERDVRMLQKKRRQRERRNLSDDELQQRLRQAQTEPEYNALAAEVKRRGKVARIAKVFGGVSSSATATRKALDEAGWGRHKQSIKLQVS